jgi:oligopeptide transport system substrate-binding protein
VKRDLPRYVRAEPFLLSTYFSINIKKKPFDDVRVRTALAMAIDREFIAQKVLKIAKPSYQFVPPGMPGYQPATVTWKDEDQATRRARAKALLEAAGFGPSRPLQFSYSYRSGGSGPQVAVAVQGDWQEIAPWVRVELRPSESAVHYANLRAKNFEIGDGGWVADYVDPQNYLYLLQTNAGSQNYAGYSSPVYDGLMNQANHEQDAAVRAALMQQAEQTMLNDMPIIPLDIGLSTNLVDPRITGFENNLQDVHRARWMCLKSAKK